MNIRKWKLFLAPPVQFPNVSSVLLSYILFTNIMNRGAFQSFTKCTRFFQNKRFLRIYLLVFLKNKGIFAKGVRDLLGVKCPS